jgi:hypothetical protein
MDLVNNRETSRLLSRRDGSRRKKPLERSNPCGEREYRAALSLCQANSEKAEIVNENGPFPGSLLHRDEGISYRPGRDSSTLAIASG